MNDRDLLGLEELCVVVRGSRDTPTNLAGWRCFQAEYAAKCAYRGYAEVMSVLRRQFGAD